MTRQLKYFQAIQEATDQALGSDEKVLLMGLGVPGPTGVFGTTSNLQQKYGHRRVFDMPSSENAMTGVAIVSVLRMLTMPRLVTVSLMPSVLRMVSVCITSML